MDPITLTKGTDVPVSLERPYTGSSANFNLSAKVVIDRGNVNQMTGKATRISDTTANPVEVASFDKWQNGQMNVRFNDGLTVDEQTELVSAFNEVVNQIKAK